MTSPVSGAGSGDERRTQAAAYAVRVLGDQHDAGAGQGRRGHGA